MDKPERLETEPIFGIRIVFADGSQPMEWFNLNLTQATKVLQEWSKDWILFPETDCSLNSAMWRWHANVRRSASKDDEEDSDIETYADILDACYYPEIEDAEEEETEPCE